MSITRSRAALAFLAAACLVVTASRAWAIDSAQDFKQNCSSCHTIGGGVLTGPDLQFVEKRKDRPWLIKFITDPSAVLDSGDTYANNLLLEARNVRMPNIAGMSAKRAEALLNLIATESQLEKSQFKGVTISTRPFTKVDIDLGREYFKGSKSLTNGGAACMSCHHVGGLGGFGGGRLGVDLTKVYERYGDRKKLAAWLSAPATETMLPTFRNHPLDMETEILPLVAYFEDAAKNQQEEPMTSMFLFVLIAAVGAGALLALAGKLWSFRFTAVRKPLTKSSSWAEKTRTSLGSEGTSR